MDLLASAMGRATLGHSLLDPMSPIFDHYGVMNRRDNDESSLGNPGANLTQQVAAGGLNGASFARCGDILPAKPPKSRCVTTPATFCEKISLKFEMRQDAIDPAPEIWKLCFVMISISCSASAMHLPIRRARPCAPIEY